MKYLVLSGFQQAPPSWQLSSLFLFFIIVIFPGSVPALPGPGLRDARGAFSLRSGLPPACASGGRRRRRQWSTEPDADRRANQHRLGGLGQPTTHVLLQLPVSLEFSPCLLRTSVDTLEHHAALNLTLWVQTNPQNRLTLTPAHWVRKSHLTADQPVPDGASSS